MLTRRHFFRSLAGLAFVAVAGVPPPRAALPPALIAQLVMRPERTLGVDMSNGLPDDEIEFLGWQALRISPWAREAADR